MGKELRKLIKYFNGYGSPYDEIVITIAKQQIPKKLKAHIKIPGIGACPICGTTFVTGNVRLNYCSYCGQRWGVAR